MISSLVSSSPEDTLFIKMPISCIYIDTEIKFNFSRSFASYVGYLAGLFDKTIRSTVNTAVKSFWYPYDIQNICLKTSLKIKVFLKNYVNNKRINNDDKT